MVMPSNKSEMVSEPLLPDFILVSDLLDNYWSPSYIKHLSVSGMLQFRVCPIAFALSRITTISQGILNPYLYTGSLLHTILEAFYYNIAIPIPDTLIVDDDGKQTTLNFDTSKKEDIAAYFYAVLRALATKYNINSIALTDTDRKTAEELISYAELTLWYFAREEAIRYLSTPTHLFKPLLIESKVNYYMPDVPIPILGYIDVVFPSSNPSEIALIPKDYKNRSSLSHPVLDKIQAYVYAYGLYKQYEYLPSKFIFKYIHGKTLSNPDILYKKNIYPILHEHAIKIKAKKLPIIEQIVKEIYERMMDKSNYKIISNPEDCPNSYGCPFAPLCKINAPLSTQITILNPEIATELLRDDRREEDPEEHKTSLLIPQFTHIRNNEIINTLSDGFITIEEYLSGKYLL